MGAKISAKLTSAIEKKDPEDDIKNPAVRILNVFSESWRGIIGTIPLIAVPFVLTDLEDRPHRTVKVIWYLMFWFLLIQPVNVPVTGLVPIFAFPCLHVLSSDDVCTRFFNPTMVLFIVGGYVLMLLNDSGFDKRAILWFLSPRRGPLTTYGLLIRSSFAAFSLSMFSNRLMVTSAIIDFVNQPLMDLQSTAKERGSNTEYSSLRYIFCNAICTSSAIGSTAILHASYATLAMRTIWELHGATPDVFNFFQYSVFALPVAVIMFLLNLAYHAALLKIVVKNPMSSDNLIMVAGELKKIKKDMPSKMTLHEILSIIFLALSLVLYFGRWSEIIRKFRSYMGWAHYREIDALNNPRIADATVSSLFAIVLHIIPTSYGFVKYFKRKLKKRELPPTKPEPAVLFWRFVDQNTTYGYILLIGGGVALDLAVGTSGLAEKLQTTGGFVTKLSWSAGIGLICFFSVLYCNVMTSVAVVIMVVPFVLNMAPPDTIWYENLHLCVLAVGIGCSFGFALPFRYTPAYFMKERGHVPLLQQIKYAVGSAVICFVVLWVAMCFYAEAVFVGDTRIATTAAPTTTTESYLETVTN